MERKKPKFFRQTWHRTIKLGSTRKKKRKWRAAKGKHSKIRRGEAGRAKKPKIGWGNKKQKQILIIRNLKQFEGLKEKEILIGRVGKRKQKEIIKKANEQKIKILNKYRKTKQENATG